MAKISVKMTCEYELKFIAGIDPTIVWMDIIGMIGRFGTSESANYGLSQKVAAQLGSWSADPYKMLDDIVTGIKNALLAAKDELVEGVMSVYNAATVLGQDMINGESGTAGSSSAGEAANKLAEEAKNAGLKLVDTLVGVAREVVAASVMKYRVEMMGIVNSLTGNPSTPWHITIGNPLRPVFCSGDMLVTETTLKLGPELAFNDLPSSIVAEFTMINARNLGLQEIMAKFNSGYLRTVDVQKTFFETTVTIDKKKNNAITKEDPGYLPGEGPVRSDPAPVVNQGGGGDTGTSGTTGTSGNQGGNGTQGGGDGTQGTLPKTDVVVPGANGTQGTGGSNTEQSKLLGGQK
jgi:hypothetical protein